MVLKANQSSRHTQIPCVSGPITAVPDANLRSFFAPFAAGERDRWAARHRLDLTHLQRSEA